MSGKRILSCCDCRVQAVAHDDASAILLLLLSLEGHYWCYLLYKKCVCVCPGVFVYVSCKYKRKMCRGTRNIFISVFGFACIKSRDGRVELINTK